LRRAWDQAANAPLARRLEKKIIRTGAITGLSKYTQTRLNALAGKECVKNRLSMGVDTDRFRPALNPMAGKSITIGFTGRLDDPRKNIGLLIRTLAWIRARNADARALLVGGPLDVETTKLIEKTGTGDHVELIDRVTAERLPELLQRMDVFLIPSAQEGLCIAALEAMSCGIPVVSTRCGGPQEFVREGINGYLTNATPAELGKAVLQIMEEPAARRRLGEAARALVETEYGLGIVRKRFWDTLEGAGIPRQ